MTTKLPTTETEHTRAAGPRHADNPDDDSPADNDPEVEAAEAAGEIAGSAEHAGMGRGERPRAPAKARENS